MPDLDLTDRRYLIIRPARGNDVEEIWSLLHANCRAWTVPEIRNNLDQLYILAKNRMILGVLYGARARSLHEVNPVIEWIEVHPLYPEKELRDLLSRGIREVWYDRLKPASRLVNRERTRLRGAVSKLQGGKQYETMAGRDCPLS